MKEFTDIWVAQPIERKLLEADVQEACVKWARERGYWARKFSSPANRSVPDYLFAGIAMYDGPQNGIKFFVEFKAPKKTATENQIEEQGWMRDAGWGGMQECDDIDKFKTWVLEYEKDHAYLN